MRAPTRREFVASAARLGAGAAALAALGPPAARAAPPGPVSVLVADLTQSTAAFAGGQARGLTLGVVDGRAELRSTSGGEFTSGAVALPFAATHLGLHWIVRSVSPDTVAVAVRTSDDGRAWSDWRSLAIEAVAELGADQGSPEPSIPVHGHGQHAGTPGRREVFAALTDGRRSRFAQYRALFPSGQTAGLEAMTVTAINSVDGTRATAAPAAGTSADFTTHDGTPFTVITREGWGCDESLRFRAKKEIWPEMYVPSKKDIVHHTATANGYTDGGAEVRAIYAYHARTLRWGDIGYNALVDKNGVIYEGRHGRGEDDATREILSDDVVAGHVFKHNYGSFGIAAVGTFDAVEPTDKTKKAIEHLLVFDCGRQLVDPSKSSDFLQSDDVWHAGLPNVSGHRDSYGTSCPGDRLYAYLPTLRANVAARLNGTAAPVLNGPPTGHGSAALTEPATLTFSWSSGVASYCLEGWYKPPDAEPITYRRGYADASGTYADPGARVQAWTPTSTTSLSVTGLSAGHYTMHVRSANGAYEANLTYLVKPAGA